MNVRTFIFLVQFCVLLITKTQAQTKPSFQNYLGNEQARNALGNWLLKGRETLVRETHEEFPPYDGWYNNLARPDSGAIDGRLLRRSPAAYEDGTYIPIEKGRPNPFELSEQLLSGPVGSRSRTGKNALLVFFGQQVVEEILDAQRAACPPEYFNIEIPKNHMYRNITGHTVMPLLRTRFDQRTGINPNNPRQQLNEITPYLDGGLMYGITKQWADQLRTYRNGTVDPDGLLAYSENGLFPERNIQRLPLANPPPPFHHAEFIKNHEILKVDRFFKLGNPRGNENTFLLTFGVLWFRWHNYLARNIRVNQPAWSSERVFNEARKWVIATQQHIVLEKWLPSWINGSKIPAYKGYDPSIDPQIDQFFQSAAFRFGHTLVTPGVYMRDYGRNGCRFEFRDILGTNAVRTCNAFWRPQDALLSRYDNQTGEYMDIDRMLMGMASQFCEAEDHKIVEDLRGNVFGPLEFPRRDLMAVNIQRGRDHGLPGFNSARRAFNLEPITSFDHFRYAEKSVRDNMAVLYNGSIENIDVWVGGILETGDGPGELFETIIIDQFRRIRDADRFWYENKANKLFTDEEIARIKQIEVYDIIMAVTKMDPTDIPRSNVFRVPLSASEIHKNCQPRMKPVSNCSEMGVSDRFDCFHLPLLNAEALNESCVQGTTYDYFYNSEASYILTFTFLSAFIAGLFGLIFLLIRLKNKPSNTTMNSTRVQSISDGGSMFIAKEWVGPKQPSRMVVLCMNPTKNHLEITTTRGVLVRSIDCNRELLYEKPSDKPYLILKPMHEYDLVLQFETEHIKFNVEHDIKTFMETCGYQLVDRGTNVSFKILKDSIVTKEARQQQLEMFFRVVIAQAFKIPHDKRELLKVDHRAVHLMKMELSLTEFADVLNMTADSVFVSLMFNLVDKDRNGFISFRELVDLMIIFVEGTAVDKAELLFKMYDIDNIGELSKETFKEMMRSFLENVKGDINNESLNSIINTLLPKKEKITFKDFLRIMEGYTDTLNDAKLGFKYPTNFRNVRQTVEDIYGTPEEIREVFKTDTHNPLATIANDTLNSKKVGKKFEFIRLIEKYSKEIFWMSLYTFVLLAVFAERAYYYSVEREHSGLRRIAGYGVTVTRGAASAMMFTYSSLLVTMCRNVITKLRDTVANKYFPFDSSVEIHKYIAYWALLFTIMHIVGHAFNFYHIATQTSDDLTCLFRNYFHATHVIPKFHYWCWQTMTGFTGVVLTVIGAIIYIFAQTIVRRKLYNCFWYTHSLYPIFFIFMVLHGSGRLIQEPFFYYFFLGPVILFVIDQAISISRKKIEIIVVNAKILPSNVTMLEIERPNNFEYKSGQWVRIACVELNSHEFHPFTLSSSPDENNITLHIRAVGPWTNHIRRLYDLAIQNQTALPKIYLDGPFGEGHQDWHQYDVSILIGGGIGVTPFASILKDIVARGNSKQLTSKKVYFIWISKNQKQFEWLVDMLKEIESKDLNKIISTHIYITQFYEKFDLRTIMLYIFERHYQKLSNKSLFTNLEAVTHFGRPNFNKFFKTIQEIHLNAPKIGVFSCGNPTMVSSVDTSCIKINKSSQYLPVLEHHYKTF